jgi:hypothetical protein
LPSKGSTTAATAAAATNVTLKITSYSENTRPR